MLPTAVRTAAARLAAPRLMGPSAGLPAAGVISHGPSMRTYHPAISPAPRAHAPITSGYGGTNHFSMTLAPRDRDTGRYASGELTPTPLSQAVYDHIAERDMETLYESLEELCESHGAAGWEVEYSAGVLNLSLPPHGTYVLNKQPPNQQIWMSSPISGPCRFGFVADADADVAGESIGEDAAGAWSHFRKEGVTLGTVLEGEVRALCEDSGVGEGWTGLHIA